MILCSSDALLLVLLDELCNFGAGSSERVYSRSTCVL